MDIRHAYISTTSVQSLIKLITMMIMM